MDSTVAYAFFIAFEINDTIATLVAAAAIAHGTVTIAELRPPVLPRSSSDFSGFAPLVSSSLGYRYAKAKARRERVEFLNCHFLCQFDIE
jgi:hypothetical protein